MAEIEDDILTNPVTNINWDMVTNYDLFRSVFKEDELKQLNFSGYCSGIEHPSRLMKFNDEYVPVDEPIADLIEDMNLRGFHTKACCCGHDQKDCYYIMLDVNEKNKNLIDKLNRYCLVDPYSEDAIRCAGRGGNYTDELERVFVPTEEIKSHVRRYEYSTAYGHLAFYFYWKTKEDIEFINEVIRNMMNDVEKVTVADLIKELQKLPQDAEVLHYSIWDGEDYPVQVTYNDCTNRVFL